MNRRMFLGAAGATVGAATVATTIGKVELLGGSSRPAGAMARNRRFPNVTVFTHDNRKVRFYDDLVKGKTVLINFMFTSCEDDCPLTSANLKQVQELLGDRVGKDVFLYSISLDPEHDTPAVLADYAKSFDARPGWKFLTGSVQNIETLRRSFGLVDLDPVVDADREQHIGMCWIGHEPLQRWSSCPALTRASAKARYVEWATPNGARPAYDEAGFSS